VKLRGVRVGRVADLNILYNAATNKSVVLRRVRISRNMIIDDKGRPIDLSERPPFRRWWTMVCAPTRVVGLATGLLFVELDFYDPQQYPAGTRMPAPNTSWFRPCRQPSPSIRRV